ncbi:MAG: transketolase, partial [Oscillospiraceae bacterium]|nr:transketolase [Oscillospiraceae bacterium]
QYDGKTDEVLSMGDLAKKWLSFGWETRTVDGHNVEALAHALNSSNKRPLVVIAETVKGKGVSFMENKPKWHNAVLSDELYAQAQKEQVSRYATI